MFSWLTEVNARICVFSKNGGFKYKFLYSKMVRERNMLCSIKVLPTGLIGTGRVLIMKSQVREKNGSICKRFSFLSEVLRDGDWVPFNQFVRWRLVFACSKTENKLYFLSQTYRALRPNPSKDAPLPEVISVTQPVGTNHLEIKYRITDADSAKVKAGFTCV